MDKATVLTLALLLTGCGESPPTTREVDQCLRREILMQCLATVPKGPEATRYNDWDEVVSKCGDQAYSTALRQIAHIKDECRP